MGMFNVKDLLPKCEEPVICFGIDEEGETKAAEGFRTVSDDKIYEWENFDFMITHWMYSPIIDLEEDDCDDYVDCDDCSLKDDPTCENYNC